MKSLKSSNANPPEFIPAFFDLDMTIPSNRFGFILGSVLVLILVLITAAATQPLNLGRGVTDFSVGPMLVNSAGLSDVGTHYLVRAGEGVGAGLALEIGVTGGDLADFSLDLCDQIQSGGTCNWYTYLSATDWDTATANLTFVSATGPHEVVSGGFAHAHVRVPARAVRFRAQSDTATAIVTIRGVVTNK